jgi:hypothetical protein
MSQLSEQYEAWVAEQQNVPPKPLLEAIEGEFARDLKLQNFIVSEVMRENSFVDNCNQDFYECRNCFVRVLPNPGLNAAIGPYCSPNCALRANQDAYSRAEITYKTYDFIIDRISQYFGVESIRPFPVFSEFRGSVQDYHAQAALPSGFNIAYYDRRLSMDEIEDTMELS